MSCSKTIFVTYCSGKKNHSVELLPAIERYQSDRIRNVVFSGEILKLDSYILSGKFGLISYNELIPDYDLRLENKDLEKHSRKVELQLDKLNINQIIFFTRPVTEDKNVEPYLELMKRVCKNKRILLTIINLPAKRIFFIFSNAF